MLYAMEIIQKQVYIYFVCVCVCTTVNKSNAPCSQAKTKLKIANKIQFGTNSSQPLGTFLWRNIGISNHENNL